VHPCGIHGSAHAHACAWVGVREVEVRAHPGALVQEPHAQDVRGLGADIKVMLTPSLYMVYGDPLMKYTGRCQNDFSVQG
jgi:hypothetical protein